MSEDHHRIVLFLLCMRHLYIAILDHITYQTHGHFWVQCCGLESN